MNTLSVPIKVHCYGSREWLLAVSDTEALLTAYGVNGVQVVPIKDLRLTAEERTEIMVKVGL